MKDFSRYYHLERYLFEDVSERFQKDKMLGAFDFFCIVIWKANRAKSKVAKRLLAMGYADIETAVAVLTVSIFKAEENRDRLRLLVEDWGFRLPMASAILTVLYPNDFTVYDIRVCEILRDFSALQYKVKFDAIWSGYCAYLEGVRLAEPDGKSLREKDRHLWGKSFANQLERDIESQFAKEPGDEELDV